MDESRVGSEMSVTNQVYPRETDHSIYFAQESMYIEDELESYR